MREYKRYTCMNSGNTRKGTSINSIKVTYEFKKRNSRDSQGAWKDVAQDGRLEIHATAALL